MTDPQPSALITPRTLEAATAMLEAYAQSTDAIGLVEAARASEIARVNSAADAELVPLVAHRAAQAFVLERWWKRASSTMTSGKRKSIELGGCHIGTRTAPKRVEFDGPDEKAALAAIEAARLNAKATVLKRVLDKRAIGELLRGATAAGRKIAEIGFRFAGGEESFFVMRAENAEAKISAQ